MSSPGYAFRGPSLVFPTSAFGEVEVVSPTPTTQAAFAYGIDPLQVSKQTYLGAASVSGVNGEAVVTCGAQAGSYARMTGGRVTKYRPGQGTLAGSGLAGQQNCTLRARELLQVGDYLPHGRGTSHQAIEGVCDLRFLDAFSM